MTDRLDRALRALHDRETGESPEAEETLRQILASRVAARSAWSRRARLWIPIAAVLAFSSAALAHAIFARRTETPEAAHEPTTPALAGVGGRPPSTDVPVSPMPTVDEPTLAPSASPAISATSTRSAAAMGATSVPASPPPPGSVFTRKPSASTSALAATLALATSAPAAPVAVSSAPAASLAVSSEVGLYTRAHRLHFDGYAAAALAAWDDYLLQFPDGRFVPDARYNRAIDLIKFRRYTDARAALQPFADGAFGEYHRQDAQRLLRSIP